MFLASARLAYSVSLGYEPRRRVDRDSFNINRCLRAASLSSFAKGRLRRYLLSGLYLYFHTAGQVELRQRIYRAGRRSVYVEQALVRSKLELLPALLIHVRRAQHGKYFHFRRQGNWPCNYGAGIAYRLYNFLGRFVYQVVVVRLQFNPDAL